MKHDLKRIRRDALLSIYYAESGHPGGALSCIEIISSLYSKELRYSQNQSAVQMHDRFIMSKGHAVPALYAVAVELGFIPRSDILTLRKLGSKLQGHPHRKSFDWIETSTGSLGQGFSFAIGEALGFKKQNMDNRVYSLLGDGELQEGEVWEGAMFAGHYQLDNLCCIIDYNKMQSDDLNKNIMGLEPLVDKWKAFNWNVREIDGHNCEEIESAFKIAKETKKKPTMIIAHTIKGKGVSYMEGSPAWHGSVKFSKDDIVEAVRELGMEQHDLEELINE